MWSDCIVSVLDRLSPLVKIVFVSNEHKQNLNLKGDFFKLPLTVSCQKDSLLKLGTIELGHVFIDFKMLKRPGLAFAQI